MVLYKQAEKENAYQTQDILRFNLEKDIYYLIKIRYKQVNRSELAQRIDYKLSKTIKKMIFSGKIFTGKQEFSYIKERAKDLIPQRLWKLIDNSLSVLSCILPLIVISYHYIANYRVSCTSKT